MTETEGRYQPIEDDGVVGDVRTVALVGRNGSIDFLSYPRFDSPTVFVALSIAAPVAASHSARASTVPAGSSTSRIPTSC